MTDKIKIRAAALLLLVVALGGCGAMLAPALLLDAGAAAVGAYQNYKARQEEAAKVEEIRKLREEITRLREQLGLRPSAVPE